MKKNILKNHFFVIALLPCLVTGWFFLEYIAFDGHTRVRSEFSKKEQMISNWYPSSSVTSRIQNMDTKETWQPMIGDSAFIDVAIPRAFDTVQMTVEYNNSAQTLVEAGMISNDLTNEQTLVPFENQVIDTALTTWSVLQKENITLLQSPDAKKEYESVDAFLEDVPKEAPVGVYQYDLPIPYSDPEYKKSAKNFLVPIRFRGSHQFLAYSKDETVNATFTLIDTNKTEGEDQFIVDLYDYKNTLLTTEFLLDDGETSPIEKATDVRTLTISMDDLPEGVYRYDVRTTGDIGFTVDSAQEQFVAKNTVYEFSQEALPELVVEEKGMFLSNSSVLQFTALEKNEAKSVIIDNNNTVDIPSVKKSIRWKDTSDTPHRLHRIEKKAPVQITVPGVIGFTQKSFFNPYFKIEKITADSIVTEYEYILFSDYTPPRLERNRKIQTVEFDITQFFIDRKNLTFLLSAPNMKEYKNSIQVYSVQFDFYREPLLDRLRKRL